MKKFTLAVKGAFKIFIFNPASDLYFYFGYQRVKGDGVIGKKIFLVVLSIVGAFIICFGIISLNEFAEKTLL